LLDRAPGDGMDPKATDKLVTHVTFKVKNDGHARRNGRLWIHFGDVSQVRFGYKTSQGAELAPALEHTFIAPYGEATGGVRYVLPAPSKGKLDWHGNDAAKMIEWEVPLKPGEEAELHMAIPYGTVDKSSAAKILAVDPGRALESVRAYWKGVLYGPGEIVTPDPWINDYLAAVVGQMAQQVAFRHHPGMWMYKTSPNNYEGYWPCNAAKAMPAFTCRGLLEVDRRVLGGFVQAQTDDVGGLSRTGMGHGDELAGEGYAKAPGFLGNFGEWTANPLLLSHGLEMWALARHYRITRDARWLGKGKGSPLQAMIDGFEWIALQRKRTMREVKGAKVDHWGLLPAASAHDWLAGNTIFNDAYCIYGMTEVARLLREIKHHKAEAFAAELADYRKCLHDRYEEATKKARALPLPDGTTIPFVPRMVQELDWAKPDWTYTGYSAVRAGAWGALDPFDDLVSWSLAFLEAGMPKGEGAYYDANLPKSEIADVNWADISRPDEERHWLWRHYVEYETMWPVAGHLFLARDDLPKFFEWFFNNMAVTVHQDWLVGVESLDGVPSCAPGEGERWQAIRSMFVNERGGYDGSEESLWFLQAIPRTWLRPGARLAVRDMGTAFGGKVDLALDVAKDGDSVVASLRLAKLAVDPVEIVVRLRSGDGRPLASAEVDGKLVSVMKGDLIRLPAARSGKWRIVGRFAKGG
jgi:hypothetical protein